MSCLKDFKSQVETMTRRFLTQAGDGQQVCFCCPQVTSETQRNFNYLSFSGNEQRRKDQGTLLQTNAYQIAVKWLEAVFTSIKILCDKPQMCC